MGRNLMPEDHGFLEPHRAEAAVVVVVQVRPADAARGQTQAQLAGAGGFFGVVLDPRSRAA
jgi:hypothetical protein